MPVSYTHLDVYKRQVVISARTDAQKCFAEANSQYNLAAYTNHADEAYPLPVCAKAAEPVSYTHLILEAEEVTRTACCLLVDKEEIGSTGASGMTSRFFENAVAAVSYTHLCGSACNHVAAVCIQF